MAIAILLASPSRSQKHCAGEEEVRFAGQVNRVPHLSQQFSVPLSHRRQVAHPRFEQPPAGFDERPSARVDAQPPLDRAPCITSRVGRQLNDDDAGLSQALRQALAHGLVRVRDAWAAAVKVDARDPDVGHRLNAGRLDIGNRGDAPLFSDSHVGRCDRLA